ncbi:Uma2 family endonuclease [Aetokthonos hydrillicola Thurmond2011]|jgi:Uma2 family endonuclease|uniref:Uma2 family endonuclease n=1 Tax=Aetokthonos hydrillicola Thurmond2011 TaxID=2712845 RepID=A0AAP5I1J3_9CYAN|nr:Uma2 family endonuclease [Aetokthonos hydrillicola]MBO3460507.1 Uma2 family endonuclease [Aetokthonos hydrillicola CCALA 1050]MBW4588205.1 Uma2 family endonuclease [Aetokthonos hydrillicola CCALA 1050]MDR9893111.1 Uma2 family endonuclease [Aetokthonos hydrillicola Thurmond2011]
MTTTLPKTVTFEEFIEWYPNDGVRYELHNGVIIEMAPPTGDHEKVVGFLAEKITIEYVRIGLPYRIPKTAFVKTPSAKSAYSPDVLLLNLDNLGNEPLFQKQSTVTQAASVPLVVEVVSTNWRDDYHLKFADYEEMGIPEFWIADYAALGGKRFIGDPKQPTFSVCQLIGDEYEVTKFTGNNRIVSPTFPQLNLTAQQVFDAAL